MNNKGWVTIDFMIASMIIFLTVPSIVAIIGDRLDTVEMTRELAEGRILAENIAGTIQIVYSGGEGCSYIYNMPGSISNKPYKLTVNSSGVYIRLKNNIGKAFITPILITNGRYVSNILLEPNKAYNISNIKNKQNYTEIIIKKI
jgi:hypothetical protein